MKVKAIVVLAVVVGLVFSLTTLSQAQETSFMSAGKCLFSFQLSEGSAVVIDTEAGNPDAALATTLLPFHQLGFKLGVAYGLNKHWAVNLAGDYKFSSNKDEYVVETDKITTNSWGIRLGIDGYWSVSEKLTIFAGPGVLFSRAKIKDLEEPMGGPKFEVKNPSTNSLSLSSRMGILVKLSTNFGLYGNVGKQFTFGWLTENIGGIENKLKWWTSSVDGDAGFVLFFGGK